MTDKIEELEERVRKLELLVNKLVDQHPIGMFHREGYNVTSPNMRRKYGTD